MTRTMSCLAALLLAACAAGAGEDAAPELSVRLRPAAAAAGGFVRLDEVAELSGARAAEAAGVLLGRAPDAGQLRALTARTVGLRLEEEGFDARRFEVAGATETEIRPASDAAPTVSTVDATENDTAAAPADDELRKLAAGWLRSALATRLNCPAEDLDVRVDAVRPSGVSGDLAGAKADVQWPAGRVRLGRQNAAILLTDGDRSLGKMQTAFDAAVFRTVPVASRDLPAGRIVAAEDVAQTRVRLTDLALEIPTDAGLIPGLVASRAIAAGAPFDARSLGRETIVHRGQPVTLVCESVGVQITGMAVARSDAGLGELVTVERPGAHRQQLVGKVAGRGLVKVE